MAWHFAIWRNSGCCWPSAEKLNSIFWKFVDCIIGLVYFWWVFLSSNWQFGVILFWFPNCSTFRMLYALHVILWYVLSNGVYICEDIWLLICYWQFRPISICIFCHLVHLNISLSNQIPCNCLLCRRVLDLYQYNNPYV